MTSFELISSKDLTAGDFDKRPQQILAVHGLRTALYVTILLVALVFQVTHDQFINTGVWIPVYITLAGQFFLNSLFLFAYDKIKNIYLSNAFILSVDAVVITCLIYFTGVTQSIFIFLYLTTIIFAGLLYQRSGAVFMALWVSTLFSLLITVSPQIQGQSLYFAVGLNNLAFFAVAMLSGLLSEQLNLMGSQLSAKSKDLEALKDLNQLIVENVGSGLLTVDLGLKITYANRGAAMILDDLAISGKDLSHVFSGIAQKIRSGSLKRSRAVRVDDDFTNYRNEKLHLAAVVSPLMGPERELKGYVILFQDVTHMRRLEFQMRQQEKLAAVGRLAAGIAHEIRNPLASISGSIQLLAADADSVRPENEKLMRIVLKEIDRLNDLISEFLDFVRPDTRIEDPVDLNRLVQEVCEMVRFNKGVRSDISLTLNLSSKGIVPGHRDKLKQALLNIIINAYQAMDKTQLPRLEVESRDAADHVVLAIRDNGVGIDQNNLRRIFEPFHTTKAGGTGLGLAISHKILENHEAKIFVESEVGLGTTFTLEFPQFPSSDNVNHDERRRA